MKAAFATPGFTRLYLGLTAGMLGDSLMLIVLSIWVKTLTGSNGAAGLTFLFVTLPALVGPLLGVVVDRVPRRPFLVVANLASAVAVLPLLLVHDRGDVWLIYLVALLYGVSFVVVPAALNGLMKDLLPEDTLVDANASLSVTREALRLVGPLAGASLFALTGGGTVAVIDAVSFVIAALSVLALTVVETPPAAERLHWLAELGQGARHLRRTPLLLHPTLALGLCLLVIGFSESAVFAVLDAFDKPVEFVGPLLTVQGVGAVVGGLLSGRLIRALGEARALVLALAVLALGLAGVVVAVSMAQVVVAVAVLGSGLPVLLVAYTTLLQKQTPGPLMGRVSTTTEVLTTTPQAVSIATGALLVTVLDYRLIFGIMAAGTLLAAGYLLTSLRGRFSPQPGPVAAEQTGGPVTGHPANPVAGTRADPVEGAVVAGATEPQA